MESEEREKGNKEKDGEATLVPESKEALMLTDLHLYIEVQEITEKKFLAALKDLKENIQKYSVMPRCRQF